MTESFLQGAAILINSTSEEIDQENMMDDGLIDFFRTTPVTKCQKPFSKRWLIDLEEEHH